MTLTRWDGEEYQARFDDLARSGVDIHSEARFVKEMNPDSVLDAGCGTGRVAVELNRSGIEVVGVDLDESMLAQARLVAPEVLWILGDMCIVDLGRQFDLVLMAGNVALFTSPGTERSLIEGCSRHLGPAGALVSGFGLGRGYELGNYDAHCAGADLELEARWSTWAKRPWHGGSDYAVSVHRRRS